MFKPYLPLWFDRARPIFGALLLFLPLYLLGVAWFAADPQTIDIGYSPAQPVPFSHALHAGELGLDCRYCHTTVEKAAHAAIPSTEICMNCHDRIAANSPKLALVRESYATGQPIPWVRVHDLPDFVYFDHSAHVNRGVSCVECHDRVDRMDRVYQAKTLRMGWCLECHRNPEQHLRPQDQITNLAWQAGSPEEQQRIGEELRRKNNIQPSTSCSTCHR
ncbi:cytochrome c3 family protein [Thermogutta sp.]|uniref:cytochrome c3 family protein n=1 Tax=Thermogutta sp. TaxID=1962930 RepID=UPI00321F6EB7